LPEDQREDAAATTETGGSGIPDVLAAWDIGFPILKSRFYLWDGEGLTGSLLPRSVWHLISGPIVYNLKRFGIA
jgi:hypothetical protein